MLDHFWGGGGVVEGSGLGKPDTVMISALELTIYSTAYYSHLFLEEIRLHCT